MELNNLSALADDFAPYCSVRERLAQRASVVEIEGLPAPAKAFVLAKLQQDLGKPLFIISYNDDASERLITDLAAFAKSPDQIMSVVSTAQTLIYTEGAPDYALIGKRAKGFGKLLNDDAKFIIATLPAALQRTVSPDIIRARNLTFTKGETVEVAHIQKQLMRLGYERVETVEQQGQWARRGGIIDIFGVGDDLPVRLDFFGDEIESIRAFDPETQRSLGEIEAATILPAREMPLDIESSELQKVIDGIRAKIPVRMAELQKENLESRGDEHAARLEERVESDLAALAGRTYFDQAEIYLPMLYPQPNCLLDFVPDDAVVVLDEPSQIRSHWLQEMNEIAEIGRARAARGEWLQADFGGECPFERLTDFLRLHQSVAFSLLVRPQPWLTVSANIPAVHAGTMEPYSGRLPALYESLESWIGNRMRCVIVTKQAVRVRELLANHKLLTGNNSKLKAGMNTGGIFIFDGTLAAGFKLPDAGLMVISDPDIFGAAGKPKKRVQRHQEGVRIASYLELREGDFVVHIHHGIGIYKGIVKLKGTDGAVRDYLLLEYAGGDKVYVPSDQTDRVQRYIGANSDSPTINRLNSGEWQRATKRAQKQVKEMAAELIKLYAERHAAKRKAYPQDTPWQSEMEQAFAYEETPDQLKAIDQIKDDMEKGQPMDRLICGDVGYGKTEVAMRAAFKAVDGGRQVAVLCPTTILAQQHLNTFRERFAAYPIKIEMLSRFVSASETTKVLKQLDEGAIDIVIGTHKLLGKTVKFQNLGLLIVDEEQRFGVAHKERIKSMKKTVDVLTLTATPIPRTLHMSLSGVRDLSLINDPPEGRRPIMTYIREYDDELVREVLLRELDRKGQVYFISNRIESIYHTAEHLHKILPNARVAVGHGQMHEDDLEEVMLNFYHKEYDILVCTTIVESGLDVSNVNTIVVDNADKLGMSQLYQLRGRVGRSDKQGYAYLLYRKDKALSEIAEKRLAALREFSGLGSGYKVALRDLEIRGAGNLLGKEQSGTVSEIGFDLYTQLLSQEIQQLKGEPVEPEFNLPAVNLPLDANIPLRYIPSEAERILMYKKMTAVRKSDHVADIQSELEDRYGDPPKAVWNLLALMRLRLRCKEVGIGSVNMEKKRVIIRFSQTHLPAESVKTLSRAFLQYEFATDHVGMNMSDTPAKTLTAVEEMVEILVNALPDKTREDRVGMISTETNAAEPKKLRDQLMEKGLNVSAARVTRR